jgi:hypothetical protein
LEHGNSHGCGALQSPPTAYVTHNTRFKTI